MTDQALTPADPVQVTKEGLQRLQAELEILWKDRRPGLVKNVQRARLFLGPPASDNIATVAERDLELVDQEIGRLESLITNAQVIGHGPESPSVELGSAVTVRYEDGTEETLTVVGPLESDLARGYVSSDSPAGTALLGKASGANVTVRDYLTLR